MICFYSLKFTCYKDLAYKYKMNSTPIDTAAICDFLDLSKQSLLKGAQYLAIFITWFHQRNGNIPNKQYYFGLYQKIFHSRRLFRLIRTIMYLPKIIELTKDLRKKVEFRTIFSLLGNICIAAFYLFDNITILLMLWSNPNYRTIRRISYTILLSGIVWETFSVAIRLRHSFQMESEIKKELEDLTPTEFLEKLNEIDEERKIIAFEFVQIVGDLFPTLARTNLPEIVVRTKINKGTVGFFGMISAITSIIIKLKKKKLMIE